MQEAFSVYCLLLDICLLVCRYLTQPIWTAQVHLIIPFPDTTHKYSFLDPYVHVPSFVSMLSFSMAHKSDITIILLVAPGCKYITTHQIAECESSISCIKVWLHIASLLRARLHLSNCVSACVSACMCLHVCVCVWMCVSKYTNYWSFVNLLICFGCVLVHLYILLYNYNLYFNGVPWYTVSYYTITSL